MITLDHSCLYSCDYSFGSHVFSNLTIVVNVASSVQELQSSVLDCLNICISYAA